MCLLVSNITHHLNDAQVSLRTSNCPIQHFYNTVPVPVARDASAQFYTTYGGADFLALGGVFPSATNKPKFNMKFFVDFKFSLYSGRKKQLNRLSAPKLSSGKFHGIYDRNNFNLALKN